MTTDQIPQALIDLEKATAREMDAEREAAKVAAAQAERARLASIADMREDVLALLSNLSRAPVEVLDPFVEWNHPTPHNTSTIANAVMHIPEHFPIYIYFRIADPEHYSYKIKPNGSKFLQVHHNAYNGSHLGRALVAARSQWVRQHDFEANPAPAGFSTAPNTGTADE